MSYSIDIVTGQVPSPRSSPENDLSARDRDPKWFAQALREMKREAATNKKFTSAAVWPRLRTPSVDRRVAMRLVVRDLIEQGVIKRSRSGEWAETCLDKDGNIVQFNKIVPIYVSLIYTD